MTPKSFILTGSLAVAISVAAGADLSSAPVKLSAAEIVDRNVAARGGLDAWRAVQTMSLAGKVGAGGNQRATLQMSPTQTAARKSASPVMRPAEEVQLPFLMELARPRKIRFE